LVICHKAIEALVAPLGRESVMTIMLRECDSQLANSSRGTKTKKSQKKE
jgi:hypothetical protein